MNTLQAQCIDASHALGFRLLSELAAESGEPNILLSPFGITITLAMALNGANEQEIAPFGTILQVDPSSLDDFNVALGGLVAEMRDLGPDVILAMANSIWMDTGHPLAPTVAQRIEEHYDGEVANIDFSQSASAVRIINRWVDDKTHGKIPNLLSASQVANAIQILVNAIYFKAPWAHPFDEALTSTRAFTRVDGTEKALPMMEQFGRWLYAESDSFEQILLPYGEGRCCMQILLPEPGLSFADACDALTFERWKRSLKAAVPSQGALVLPRFEARFKADLVASLEKIGGGGRPACPGMGLGERVLNSVVHEATFEVNEEGAEAAAATAMILNLGAQPEEASFRMVVDRPFFCAILDRTTQWSLFMGWITDPVGCRGGRRPGGTLESRP